MFMLAIGVEEILPRDVLQNQQGVKFEVKSVTAMTPAMTYSGTTLHFTNGRDYFVPATSKQTFTLVHRPRPEGEEDVEAFEKVLDAVYEFDEARRKSVTLVTNKHYLKRLTDTISAYWLGEQPEPTAGSDSESGRGS